MAVEQERGSGCEAGRHGLGVTGIELDQDEALPEGPVAFGFRPELVQEGFLELEDLLDVHAGDAGFGGGGGAVGEDDVLEVVGAGRNDGGALVDLGGVEQVEDREVLDLEDLVHALNRETTLAVEKVGNVSLLESGLLGEPEASEFTCFNSLLEDFSEIVLQALELHLAGV